MPPQWRPASRGPLEASCCMFVGLKIAVQIVSMKKVREDSWGFMFVDIVIAAYVPSIVDTAITDMR